MRKLLPRHPQLDHHPLVPFVINEEMAMEKKAAEFRAHGSEIYLPRDAAE
jgi:hypothetical protein